ncbi:hypothetical protein CVT26_013283 [Gymnopilus dilepis]|uniref:WSC domain-containing protein n=1 Tax=Gymnopilus dilepis TaxID=231916 RepID=A0A409VUR4_9AGAR|nr:hypothetical protein CVT26_013283 [Gymnopilus dilepis]
MPMMADQLLFLLTVWFTMAPFVAVNAQRLSANASVLPAGWSGTPQCIADTFPDEPIFLQLLFGPNFTDPVHLTIESCVEFCDAQGSRLAGLKGTECRCGNLLNGFESFESDPGECNVVGFDTACPGNTAEACGLAIGSPPLVNIFQNFASQFECSDTIWPGGAPLTPSGSWRFSYFYTDSYSARALPHSAVTTPAPLPRGNLTVQACISACESQGFTIAGVEFGAECFCGNAIASTSHPITNCSLLPVPNFSGSATSGALIPCTGDPDNFCGGPDIISIFTLPGTGLVPVLPFDAALDDFCPGNCIGHT